MTIINSQLGGKKPTGTKNITSNGVHDVTDYANADVQVPTTAPDYYIECTKDSNNVLRKSTTGLNTFAGIKNIGEKVCLEMYKNVQASSLTVDMSSIETLTYPESCAEMFANVRGTSAANPCEINVDLSGLKSITASNACYRMFAGSSNRYAKLNVDFSSLETVNAGNACGALFATFYEIPGYLIDITFPSLKTIAGTRAFTSIIEGNDIVKKLSFPALESTPFSCINNLARYAHKLTECSFDKLSVIGDVNTDGGLFQDCYLLESVKFGGLKASTFANNVGFLQYLFNSTSGRDAPNGCTVHFPSNFDPSDPNHTFDASTLSGYPTFGGNASYIHVAFDLPATE